MISQRPRGLSGFLGSHQQGIAPDNSPEFINYVVDATRFYDHARAYRRTINATMIKAGAAAEVVGYVLLQNLSSNMIEVDDMYIAMDQGGTTNANCEFEGLQITANAGSGDTYYVVGDTMSVINPATGCPGPRAFGQLSNFTIYPDDILTLLMFAQGGAAASFTPLFVSIFGREFHAG